MWFCLRCCHCLILIKDRLLGTKSNYTRGTCDALLVMLVTRVMTRLAEPEFFGWVLKNTRSRSRIFIRFRLGKSNWIVFYIALLSFKNPTSSLLKWYNFFQGCQLGSFETRFWNSGFFWRPWLFWKSRKARQILAFSGLFSVGKAWLGKTLSELHIHHKSLLTKVYGHDAWCKEYYKDLLLPYKWSMLC